MVRQNTAFSNKLLLWHGQQHSMPHEQVTAAPSQKGILLPRHVSSSPHQTKGDLWVEDSCHSYDPWVSCSNIGKLFRVAIKVHFMVRV